jgi:UDP-N-acetylmuramate dehydrogenase
VKKVGEILGKIKPRFPPALAEPMSLHTSFRIGGPADVLLRPQDPQELGLLFCRLRQEGLPVFILGAGANILVSDRGIRGAVMELGALKAMAVQERGEEALLSAEAGAAISDASALALQHGLSGLEFIYSMPGSVGGSVWMNARCYERSLSEALEEVEYIDASGQLRQLPVGGVDFGYKSSPFQRMECLIVRATFRLRRGDPPRMRERMSWIREDRTRKGHFLYPCAGSIFKNNRAFGSPTGRIIDSLGLKGRAIGGARVSELHGNVIVNTGGARARDVLELMQLVEQAVRRAYGFELEREILLVGEWEP